MIQMMMYSITILTGFIFLQMNHPLAMGLVLLLQTMLICLITGLMMKTFWFSYVLFLIFLGGMLVLFIYVTSLASNEMFTLSTMLMVTTTIVIVSTATIYLFMDKPMMSMMLNNEMMPSSTMHNLIPENILNLNKLYNFPTNIITILLIIYLLISLVATVKITNVFYGPLRPMN
uniref:NADH-ubiquinone oxidoreductase chain 6 n=1 Tax=Hemipenthes neimengguensis TaxID=2783692 RepID=A0A7S6VJD5_9MUSC|nr:NADH dehydrogenase subunit 6 [Hemipenthes neimengguensis]QOW39621.1 NADH dehydrogenase subunit 6 [Hemipenthes neimengguensis]